MSKRLNERRLLGLLLIPSDTLLLTQPSPDALDNVNTPKELRQSVLEAEVTG